MPETLIEILVLFLLILVNGALSMSELAIVAARPTRLKARAAGGDRNAQAAIELARDPNRFLSTVQVGITLVGTMAGVFGGATIAENLIHWLRGVPSLAASSETIGLAVVVGAITFATLVLGELVPKRLAMSDPERIATAVARPLRWLSAVEVPLVRLLSASTEAVLWVLRVKPSARPSVTEDELKILIKEGTEAGVFEPAEQDMVKRVFRLGNRRAGSLVTHFSDVVWLNVADSPAELRRKIAGSPHSRFPVCDGRLDRLLGVVQVRDLLLKDDHAEPFDLRGIVKVPLLIYEGTTALRVLDLFKSSTTQMAVVLSEHGSVVGVLTISDLLGAIVGELPAENAPLESRATRRADGSWVIDGLLSTDEFREHFGLADLGDQTGDTVAGLILARATRIPSPGDRFEWHGLRLEILRMDGNRIDKVVVTPASDRPAPLES